MASQMEPWGCADSGGPASFGGLRQSQDRLGSVLFSSCRSGSLFWSSWAPLGVVFLSLLGASWSRFGAPLASFWVILSSLGPVLGRLGLFWARFRPLRAAFWSPITLYAHQFINSSTVQPMICQHFATRAGGLRAERLNLPSCERKAEL